MSKHQPDKNSVPPPPAPAPVATSTPPAPAPQPAAPVGPDPAAELETARAKAAENWDKYLRAVADLDNYRKRAIRERDELARATAERVVVALLPVLDNLERALAAAPDKSPLTAGLQQVQAQFRRTMEEFGLKEIAAHSGHAFDPNLHEAVSHVESAEHAEGLILEQLQRGYKLSERLLRPARVIVSKGASAEAGKP